MTQLEIWTCNGGANQSIVATGGTLQVEGKCFDAYVQGAATTNGAKLLLYTCNGKTNQQWTRQ